ncbi:MAG: NfeD family protein [Oleiphilaceae bacterium]|nr:NfeD family protein [Oleiphilaceae bacterium]
MEWTTTHLWLALALILGLAELTSGVMVLLALGLAAALTAVLAFLGLSLPWQLVGMGLFSGFLIPIVIRVIRPRFTPHGVAYGTTGTGVEKNQRYMTIKRDFDNATGIKVNGDFYRLKIAETGESDLPEDTEVIFDHFDGTTAIVHSGHHQEQ